MMSKFFGIVGVAPFALVAAAGLTGATLGQVTIYGGLSNFDVPNETEVDCDEFEIELHGPHPEDVYHTYRNGNYGSPTIIAIPGGTRVTYAMPRHATLPGSIEHFGISLRNFNANPAPSFMWKAGGLPAGVDSEPLQPQIVTSKGWNESGDPVLIETVSNTDPRGRRMWIKRSVSNVMYQVTLEELMPNDPLVQGSIDIDPEPVLLFAGQSRSFDQLEIGDGIASAVINYEVYRDRVIGGVHTVGPYAGMVMNAVTLSSSMCDLNAPFIIDHPVSQTVHAFGEIELSVRADSNYDFGPLNFQWVHEGTDMPGANGDAITLSDIVPDQGGAYWCVISNDCGMVISDAAHVTVIPCPADYSKDGAVDFFDYDEFVSDFQDGSPRSDFDGDHTIDFFDYDAFVRAFEVPC
ncbi:MAG: hypothetical protein AABZ53_11540 [Planctomycetota bacterium]